MHDSEKYLDEKIMFMEKEGNSDLYLEPGDYAFPFQVTLPANVPTSFEHAYGRIRYSLNGTIDIPWAVDKHTTLAFSVISHVDLNQFPNLRQSAEASDSKTLCCGPCKSAPITGELSIRKGTTKPNMTNIRNYLNVTLNEMKNKMKLKSNEFSIKGSLLGLG